MVNVMVVAVLKMKVLHGRRRKRKQSGGGDLGVHAAPAALAFRACSSRKVMMQREDVGVTASAMVKAAQHMPKTATTPQLPPTCNEVCVVVKHINFLCARAAGRFVEHSVDVSEQHAHVSAHFHRHQRG